jgi:hypothetical protein
MTSGYSPDFETVLACNEKAHVGRQFQSIAKPLNSISLDSNTGRWEGDDLSARPSERPEPYSQPLRLPTALTFVGIAPGEDIQDV